MRSSITRWPKLSRPAVLCGALLLVACGSATPQASSRADDADYEDSDWDEADEARDRAASGGKCYEKCQQFIEDADALLGQAQALKGADKARLALHKRAGEAYFKAWLGCHLSLPDGEDLSCKGARDVTANLVKAFAGAQRNDWLVFAYLVALDDRWRDDGSDLAADAPGELRRAADAAAEEAKSDPKGEHAAESLASAVYGYLALEEVTVALQHASVHRRRFARSDPDGVSLVAAAVAAYFNDREQWNEALTALPGATRPGRAKLPRTKILWHAERGRALAGQGRDGAAAKEFRAVLRVWRPPEPDNLTQMVGRQAPAPMLGRERLVDAVGAAQFFLAEQKRRQANRLEPPPYRGPKTPDGVEAYIGGALGKWAQQRQKLVNAAQASYQKVFAIRPMPPPRWVVAASGQIGKMWARFAEDMVSVELPPKLANDPDTQAAFEKAMRGSAKPAREAAEQALQNCRKYAKRYRSQGDYGDACE